MQKAMKCKCEGDRAIHLSLSISPDDSVGWKGWKAWVLSRYVEALAMVSVIRCRI
jgi:hypothetical protein